MKPKYLRLIGITIVLTVSCKDPMPELPEKYKLKDSRYTKIEGQVLEYGTNKPLSYASVILQEAIYERGSGGGNYISIDTIQADAEGKYSIEFMHLPSTSTYSVAYQIYCKEFWYYSDSYDMEESYGYRHNLVLDPYGWIKIHIKNINPLNEKDTFSATTDKGGGGEDYIGMAIDTTVVYRSPANRKNNICAHVWRDGNYLKKCDSVYFKAHDTVPFEILY